MRRSIPLASKTYGHMATMPRLPVPPLAETADLYLRTLRPLLSAKDLEVSTALMTDFIKPDGVGQALHAKLCERAEQHPNWLEKWWDTMYIDLRCPNPVHVNYGLLLDLPTPTATAGDVQTEVAARLVAGSLAFKQELDAEAIEPDATRDGPLCMNQFARLFGHARIPHQGRDALVCSGSVPAGLPYPHFATTYTDVNPKHIAVLARGRFYSVDVLADDGTPLSIDAIDAGLRSAKAQAESASAAAKGVDPVFGSVTAGDRDVWAGIRATMMGNADNGRSFESLEAALFVVVLDHDAPGDVTNAASESVLLGEDGMRWFDKHQFIVFADGQAGANFEHAPGDGTMALRLLTHVQKSYDSWTLSSSASSSTSTSVTPLPFDTSAVEGEVVGAAKERQALMDSFDTDILTFGEYGGQRIKLHNCSPDAYAQMAIQLGSYMVHDGEALACYESNSTRGFLHGRTETVRSTSSEAVAFCAAMTSSSASSREKLDALHAAVGAHQQYMSVSKNGYGVDRPLYGLKNIALDAGQDLHPVFTDDAFGYSCAWRLSTSHLGGPAKTFTFGPVVGDGYGFGYYVKPDHLRFNVTGWRDGTPSAPSDMTAAVKQALLDMDQVCSDLADDEQ